MKMEIDKKYWGKIYRATVRSHLKVDDNGAIGWSEEGAYSWDSAAWNCGKHQHWSCSNFDKFKVVYEHSPCLENK